MALNCYGYFREKSSIINIGKGLKYASDVSSDTVVGQNYPIDNNYL